MVNNEPQVLDLIAKRQAAEKVIEDMPEGPIKEKAFEMAFQHLLLTESQPVTDKRRRRTKAPRSTKPRPQDGQRVRASSGPQSLVTELVREGFFDEPKGLRDIRAELETRGHRLDAGDLGPVMPRLTRAKVVRRERQAREGQRPIWVYVRFDA